MSGRVQCELCDFCSILKPLHYHQNVRISKATLRKLPGCFEETLLGEPKGALRQFRGSYGSHVLEYEEYWIVHRDVVDPRIDPIGHLVNDAPHVLLLSVLVALFIGLMLIRR